MNRKTTEKDCRKFTKRQWKAMRIITPADYHRGVIRADSDGNMFLWFRANGKHVWASLFTQFPYRNDLHRHLCNSNPSRGEDTFEPLAP